MSPTLRHRKVAEPHKKGPAAESPHLNGSEFKKTQEEVVWGKTPSGEVFRVPTTHDVLTLFNPAYPKSHLDLLNLSLLGLQLVLFFCLPRYVSKCFFLGYFAFWRMAYDGGLGWVLTKQSKKKWIVREVQRLGWLDEKRRPHVRNWIRAQLAGKMGKDYSFDTLPLEYNTWLLFRQLVDIILLNDFLAYCMFAFSCFRVPEGLPIIVHIIRWLIGIALIGFNLWVKTEAHNVVKDYGWYWGDVFFQRGALVFDGVFELAPHPMYSVGYAGYYGLSLIVGSYPVLFVSLAAHAAQFAFLIFFENPHIQRMYGKRKPLAERRPLFPSNARPKSPGTQTSQILGAAYLDAVEELSTPAATEGETATETDWDLQTETETECDSISRDRRSLRRESRKINGGASHNQRTQSATIVSQHDLLNKYFRKDPVLLHNIDLLRAPDAMLVLIMFYALICCFLPSMSSRTMLALHFVHACSWCIFHSFGLGLLLRAQSRSKFLVRHFLKHYPYPSNDGGRGAIQESFTNWKSLYNMSICMTYISMIALTWKTYELPSDWSVGDELLRHTLGALLVGLHIWAAMESFEVLGVFGWFYGDFFMEDFPTHLEYTGIYRYLDNPEVTSGASFFGLALISGSKLLACLAVLRFVSHWWFLRKVENPHMRRLYGDSLRKEAGFVKVMKTVASKNARLLEIRAGRHAPEIRRVAKEVSGTFGKVYDETAEVVEEFLARSKPRISEVVEETKILLQQSRERLIITRLANDLSSYDTAKYKISIAPSRLNNLRFHLGEPIQVTWQAPKEHSRRDWIGIYRRGANKSALATKTSSMGMWVPVHSEEWDGDIPLSSDRSNYGGIEPETGSVIFQGDTLPWSVGNYEVRYHHDGKYNVLSLDGPFEIYVDKPLTINFASVRDCLASIVTLCLDRDPSLIPLSCRNSHDTIPDDPSGGRGRDVDDFSFWSERQAKRISSAIKEAFDVEYAPEVIVAEANITALANRILVSKHILHT